MIEFNIIEQQLKGPGFWKLNVSLLMNDDYVNAMECNIPLWKEESKQFFADSKMAWEWVKFKIREFSVDFSKKLAYSNVIWRSTDEVLDETSFVNRICKLVC